MGDLFSKNARCHTQCMSLALYVSSFSASSGCRCCCFHVNSEAVVGNARGPESLPCALPTEPLRQRARESRACISPLYVKPDRAVCLPSMNGALAFVDTSDCTVMNIAEHYMASDVEWDPTGRYVVTSVSGGAIRYGDLRSLDTV